MKCGQLNLRDMIILLVITIPKLNRGTFSTAGLLRIGPFVRTLYCPTSNACLGIYQIVLYILDENHMVLVEQSRCPIGG